MTKKTSVYLPLSLATIIFLGLAAGIARGFLLSEMSIEEIKSQIIAYKLNMVQDSASLFSQYAWKYGKDMLLIFVLAFVPFGSLGVYVLLGIKAMSYGFSACAVIRGYGLSGVIFGFSSFGLGGMILLPAMAVLGYAQMQKKLGGRLSELFLVFLTICVCVLLVSFIEAFVFV